MALFWLTDQFVDKLLYVVVLEVIDIVLLLKGSHGGGAQMVLDRN